MASPVTLSGLPVVGSLSYGGVQFEELLKSKITGHAEWDRSKRVVKYIRYILEVDGYVISTDSQSNDPTWSNLRYVLQQPGLPLTYSERGFSNFNINTGAAGSLVDVCDGPRPEVLGFVPMGAGLAAQISWKCEVCLPEIATERVGFQIPFPRGIVAFNWSTDLSFGDDGYADYTVEGELEIARVAGRRGRDYDLESYRAYTEPQLPPGFKPTARKFKADEAKRTIKFVYSFKELPPMGLPVRCTKASGSYNVSCNKGPALINWTANLQASYTVVPTGPRREAYLRFLGLFMDRIKHVRRSSVFPTVATAGGGGGGGGVNAGEVAFNVAFGAAGQAYSALSSLYEGAVGVVRNEPAPPRRSNPIIRKFVINEGLYEDSKSSSFECSWTFYTTFRSIFSASGCWRPMADCAGQNNRRGRDVWVTDMASIVGYTSWYNYGFRPTAEVVLSPNSSSIGPADQAYKRRATGATLSDNNRAATAGAGLVRTGVDPDSGESPENGTTVPGLPTPESSWLNYEIEFVTDLDPGMALHKALPQRDDPVDSLGSVDPFDSNPESVIGGVNTTSQSSGQDLLQRMATSTYRVVMRGYGVRAGYKVPVPDLKVFGGVEVSPSKQRVVGPKIMANYSGVPIYMTAWVLWYDVPSPPTSDQAAPPNLEQHIGDVAKPPDGIQVPISVPEPPIGRVLPGDGLQNIVPR